MQLQEILTIVALLITFMAVWLILPSWMVKQNLPKVIEIFRKKDAVGIHNAKTPEELGLQQKPLLQRLMSRRDYKPNALQLLIQTNVVRTTGDGKLYITEQSVSGATWLKLKK